MIEEDKIQIMRSLLQKGVRKGNTELVETLFDYLVGQGELSWLRKRFVVIVFEECWPLGFEITDKSSPRKIKEILLKVTRSEKNKDAAGLADMGNRIAEKYGNKLHGTKEENEAVRLIANFIGQPDVYWNKLNEAAKQNGKSHLVINAKELSKSASFPFDKALMFSAALLAITKGIPKVEENKENKPEEDFPYWCAIDKHTQLGKYQIIEYAKSHEDYHKNKDLEFYLRKYQFYFEGAKCDKMSKSRFWDLNVYSDLLRMERTPDQALKEWEKYKKDFIKHLEYYENQIKEELMKKDEPDLFG